MASRGFMVTKANATESYKTLIGDIHACLFTGDDGDTDEETIAWVIDECRLLGYPLPDGYFDTVMIVSTTPGGLMLYQGNVMIIRGREFIFHTY